METSKKGQKLFNKYRKFEIKRVFLTKVAVMLNFDTVIAKYRQGPLHINPKAQIKGSAFDVTFLNMLELEEPIRTPNTPERHVMAPNAIDTLRGKVTVI